MLRAQWASTLVYHTALAFVAIDHHAKVQFWNKGAEQMFGYSESEVLGRGLPFLTPDSQYEFQVAFERVMQGKGTSFKSQKRNRTGEVLDLLVHASPVFEEQQCVGMSLIFQDHNILKKTTFIPYANLNPFLRESKRTFEELREVILASLYKGKMTINQVAHESGINWRTVEKHLTFLIGKKLVREVFSSEYVRIFELDELGRRTVDDLKARELSKLVKEEKQL